MYKVVKCKKCGRNCTMRGSTEKDEILTVTDHKEQAEKYIIDYKQDE